MNAKESYTTIDERIIDLSGLTRDQKTYLGETILPQKEKMNVMDFLNRFLEDPVVLNRPEMYDVCRDLGTRMGILQGYLKRESYDRSSPLPEKELTSTEVAAMGQCSAQAVRDAIQSGRLFARYVGGLYLIKEQEAKAFISTLRKNKKAHSRTFSSHDSESRVAASLAKPPRR